MWNNVVVEAFCMGKEKKGKYPCGRRYPDAFCLGRDAGHCPHFAYSDSTEREAARFVPFRVILWDRILTWWEEAGNKVSWIFWDQLWFNRRKVDAFFDNIKVISDDDPSMAEFNKRNKECEDLFPAWLEEAKKGW
jgi:hypothetical protein